MQVKIFDKGTNGLPGATEQADLTGRLSSVSFTHAALWGPLTATIQWSGTLDEAFRYADQYLGAPISIYDPAGVLQWEGIIWTVTFRAGRRRRSRSLEGYANYCQVNYRATDFSTSPPTDIGPATPEVAQDAAGQAIYGRIGYLANVGGVTQATAANTAATDLAERTRLLYLPDTGALDTNTPSPAPDTIQTELYCVGFYRTLYYQWYTSAATGTADTAVILQSILGAAAPFVVNDYTQVATTGVNQGQAFDQYQWAGDIIKSLLDAVSNWTCGLALGRIPYLRPSKRLNATADYVERLDGVLEDAAGVAVPWWSVRPDTILRQADFVPISANLTTAIDAIESVYLTETTCTVNQNGLNLSYKTAVAGIDGAISAL